MLIFDTILPVQAHRERKALVLNGFRAGTASRVAPPPWGWSPEDEPPWDIRFINGHRMRVRGLAGHYNEIEDYCRSHGLERPPD